MYKVKIETFKINLQQTQCKTDLQYKSFGSKHRKFKKHLRLVRKKREFQVSILFAISHYCP